MSDMSLGFLPQVLAMIKQFEGCKLRSYLDAAGVWTIGYGHTPSGPGKKITQAEADVFLGLDLILAENAVLKLVKVPLTENQLAALVSFVFNVGMGAFSKSTLLKKLNDGDYDAVPAELRKFVHAGSRVLPGLIRRREAEADLWSMSDDSGVEPTDKS